MRKPTSERLVIFSAALRARQMDLLERLAQKGDCSLSRVLRRIIDAQHPSSEGEEPHE